MWTVNMAHAVPTSSIERAYGYLIGDRITQRLSFDVPGSALLDPASVPKPGRVNGWLDLRAVTLERAADATRVRLDYQLMASTAEVKLIFLPARTLRFRPSAGGESINQSRVDAVPISVSPITAASTTERNGFGELRDDRVPRPIDTAGHAHRVAWLAALLATLLSLGLLQAARRRRDSHAAPFAVATRQLKRARAAGADPTRQAAALRALHRAFDQSAGKTVLGADVDAFLHANPAFAPLREPIVHFFESSGRRFYADQQPSAADAAQLITLAEQLARTEARQR